LNTLSGCCLIISPSWNQASHMEHDRLLRDPDDKPHTPAPLVVRLVIEFLGTLMFVFFGAGTASHFVFGGNGPANAVFPVIQLISVSAAHGVITMVLIYLFAKISGAHFNAGPTIFNLLNRSLPILDGVLYLVAQAFGACVGAAMLLPLYGPHHSLGTPALGNVDVFYNGTYTTREVPWYGGLFMEFFGTFFLSLAAVISSPNPVPQQALVVGATLFCIFLVGAPLDGAAMNPWRWLGPAAASGQITQQTYWWIYFVGPILGFVAGGFLGQTHIAFSKEHHRHTHDS